MIRKILFIVICLTQTCFVIAQNRSIIISDEVIRKLDISEEMRLMLSSGDIVGNGGGLAEQNFRYVYHKLSDYINRCIESNLCPIKQDYQVILKAMLPLISMNILNKDSLIFLSELRYPGFFKDLSDPQIRVAKTANIKGSPIFINLDMAYSEDGYLILSLPEMAGIIIHELGHQLGIRSHSKMDEIAAQLRYVMTTSMITNDIDFEENKVEIIIMNSRDDSHNSLFELNLNSKLIDIQKIFDEKIICKKGNLVGHRISNTHWERPTQNNEKLNFILDGWVDYLCRDYQGIIWQYSHDFSINLTLDKQNAGSHNIDIHMN